MFWDEESLLPGDIVWGTERDKKNRYSAILNSQDSVITELIKGDGNLKLVPTRMKRAPPPFKNPLPSAEPNDFQTVKLYLIG